MNALLKSVTVVDPKSDFHNATVDILIENGTIKNISENISKPKGFQEISCKDLHCSAGWFDSSVAFGEPGFEDRETLENGLKTAALAGFTSVALNSNTYPVLDNAAAIGFVKDKSSKSATTLLPIGALTVGSKAVDLAELYDMTSSGAVAFGDYKIGTDNANLMKIALQYASNFNGLVMSFPADASIVGKGVVNEHINGTKLGLKGMPNLAEELRVSRDLFLLEYTGGRLHIPTISTAGSVELIRAAKKKQLKVTCSVAIHNLVLTDAKLDSFDTNYKVNPPLRTPKDCDALIEGLKDGTIDLVTSDHNPIDIEHKNVEFDHAMFGTIGLESAFGVLNSIFSTKKTIHLLTKGKELFGLESNSVALGAKADLSLFSPNETYTFSMKDINSKSKNSCFLGQKLKGKAIGIIANNQIVINEE